MNAARRSVRCAIYTRVSTDLGLDQDFNSLDAQHDAAQAYIRSQAHAGWTLIRTIYDDGGFSGGSTDRPALQQLLADIRAHKIDVIVVYKVDRLTRSSPTLPSWWNYLTSPWGLVCLGHAAVQHHDLDGEADAQRLTVLRPVRARGHLRAHPRQDRASKRKGLWVGGMVPLGYHQGRKITIVAAEAETVRHIFRRYLELGSLNPLMTDLRKRNCHEEALLRSPAKPLEGISFTRGPLAHLLRNRFYIGEVRYKGETLPGEQPAIIGRSCSMLFKPN